MYFVKTPWYLKTVYPSLRWDMKGDKKLYLTFDDGPIPIVTEEVLAILHDFDAPATFFSIGENAEKYPRILEQIAAAGHAIGNHTYHHLNGWKTENIMYEADVERCDTVLNTPLFRPPYGRIGYQQIQDLKKKYQIIMWDVLSGDFDQDIDAGQCTKNVITNAVPGSIIVFHDSVKAKDRVLKSLPAVLTHFAAEGFRFECIPLHNLNGEE